MKPPLSGITAAPAEYAFQQRHDPTTALAVDAERVARACYDMAARFHRGGKLIVFGNGGASTDAQHVAVEFVHPVIVGKRALPAISLGADVATVTGLARRLGFTEVFAHQLRYLGAPADIALGVSADGQCANVLRGLQLAREQGMLTLALIGGDGGAIAHSESVQHVFLAASNDALIVKELHVTIYHVLWELVHVFLEQPGLLGPEILA